MNRVVDIVAQRLYAAGCRHAFGIPGGEVLAMMDALERAGVRFVLTKHENCAGFMAEGTHHASGAPGILLATIGPGVANAVNVVVNARQDQVPLIVLSGCVDEAEALTYTHQVFDHRAVLGPIAKASFTVRSGAADVVIDKAISIACDDPPGPVHIDIPIGVASAEQKERNYPQRARAIPGAPSEGPELDRARSMLAAAERPVLIAGMGVLHHHAAETVADFVNEFGIPLVTTYKAKGMLSEDHPLALGGHGLSPRADKHLMPFVEASDLVILAGYDPIEMRIGWRDPWDPQKVVEFATEPNRHYMHHAALSFVGDVGAGLKALRHGIEPRSKYWPKGEPAKLRAELKAAFSEPGSWGPHAAFAAARRAAPLDTVITADSGAHRILLSEMWECQAPRGMLQSSAFCTMGTALPIAMGYKIARPETPVIAFVGDAGLEMVLGELATLRDLELPVVVVVMVDRSLTLIEMKQRGTQPPNVGVDFGYTDFPAVAEALGGIGRSVNSAAQMENEVAAALRRQEYTVIACQLERRAYDGAF